MTAGLTMRATSNELRAKERLAAAAVDQRAGLAGPNKPVLPTASTSLNHYAPDSLRRQTGQPLGAEESEAT